MGKDQIPRRQFLQRGAAALVGAGLLPAIDVAASSHLDDDKTYICAPCSSPCDEWIFPEPGACPVCGMALIPNKNNLNGPKWPSRPLTIEKLMAIYRAPGLSLAIINDFRIAETRTYGVTEAGGSAAVSPRTLFQAGSISKPVAALGALRLVEQGRLSLDRDVDQYLKSWKVPDNQFTAEQKVTLRRLLSHTAGVTQHGFPGYAVDEPRPTLEQVLNGEKPATNKPIRVDLVPGTKWRYSGGGALISQQLMIDVSERPFPQLMHELVFKRLSMNDSTYDQPLAAPRLITAASGTHADGTPVNGKWHVYPEMAAAGLWTTPTDLAKLAIDIALTKKKRSGRLLSTGMADQMLSPQFDPVAEVALGNAKHLDRMGLGFFLGDATRPDLFGHIGDDEGFQAMLMMFADSGKGAVIMANSQLGINLGDFLLDGIAKEYQWDTYVPSDRPHPVR